jgi:hypothetical protein
MRATIETLDSHELPGFLWGKRIVQGNFVKLLIELEAGEKAIIERHDLSRYVLVEVTNPDHNDPKLRHQFRNDPELLPDPTVKYTIKDFCAPTGLVRKFNTPGEAKNWAAELRGHLEKLKEIVVHNAHSAPSKETFEL